MGSRVNLDIHDQCLNFTEYPEIAISAFDEGIEIREFSDRRFEKKEDVSAAIC